MSTSTTLPAPSNSAWDPQLWDEMQAWFYQVLSWVTKLYGITLVPDVQSAGLGFTDEISGLSTLRTFDVRWVAQQFTFNVELPHYYAWRTDPKGFAQNLVWQMAQQLGIPTPQALAIAPPPSPPPTPPSNPIGPKFEMEDAPGGVAYADIGGSSRPIGDIYTDIAGTYLKQGRRSIMGVNTWWILTAPVTAPVGAQPILNQAQS